MKNEKIRELLDLKNYCFSIINISKIPLQETAYNRLDIPSNIKLLEVFKKEAQRNKSYSNHNKNIELIKTRDSIYKDFKIDFIKKYSSNKIVTFGNIAFSFIDKIYKDNKVLDKSNIICHFNHPASSSWYKVQDKKKKLQNILDQNCKSGKGI
ncbi:MAG: hypothetical protein WBF48_08265 [Halarcobacter sp.]